MENLLNPQIVKLIQVQVFVEANTDCHPPLPKRWVTEYYDMDGKFMGLNDPTICKTCWQFEKRTLQCCTSSHK